MHEHVDYALDLGLQAIPIGESKAIPQIYFFDVVQKCNTIVLLLEKLYSASVLPCVVSTSRHSDCLQKKRFMLDQIESKLDMGLDRSISALVGWVRVYLASEQKKTDFKPETDDLDTVASAACLDVVKHLLPIIGQLQKCVDGDNLSAVMTELGVRFHRTIYEHLQQFQYNTAGKISGLSVA